MHSTPHEAVVTPSKGIASLEAAVEWLEIHGVGVHARAEISRFVGAGGVAEWHVTVCLENDGPDPAGSLENAWLSALKAVGLNPASTLMRRVFHRGAPNGLPDLEHFADSHPGAFSSIGQTPLSGGGLAIWSHHLTDSNGPLKISGGAASFSCDRGELGHHWLSALCDSTSADPSSQALRILEKHDQWLAAHDMNLADHVVRTWWFVRDIDVDYQDLVEVRRDYFRQHNLTEHTHYIASTGIAGSHDLPAARLSLDSYAISGLVPEQVKYLSAPEHLGPTHLYGVTFERATAISYSDRRHVFISGTASIDPSGEIVHPGDVMKQLERAMDNVSALLEAAGAGLKDLAVMLVYLRDPSDGTEIGKVLRERFRRLPMIVLHAPVCRPGWLVEVEGVAIVSAAFPGLPDF